MFATDDGRIMPPGRPADIATIQSPMRQRADALCELAQRGLRRMIDARGSVPFTMRRVATAQGIETRQEGESLRYAAIVALGAARLEKSAQLGTLHGRTAADFALKARSRVPAAAEPGAVALAAWAAAEAAGVFATELFDPLSALLASGRPIETVTCSWILSAAIAAHPLGPSSALIEGAAARLLSSQAESGLFPHLLPAAAQGRLRAHVSCFADQVYPIQALARLHRLYGDRRALAAAENCADVICTLQGLAGQWWWHYDLRNGDVVEGYPVYSVHQHAMAPMALLELAEAGGTDRLQPVLAGLGWLYDRPESDTALIDETSGLVWRKIGRTEPRKAVRSVSALTTSIGRGWRLPGLDLLFPATSVDYECRPYELGWLLYAWKRAADPFANLVGEFAHA